LFAAAVSATPVKENQSSNAANSHPGDKNGEQDPSSSSSSSSQAATPAGKSLKESAEEYERRRAAEKQESIRLLSSDAVVVTTGEEAERNILQLACKLFVFDGVEKNWDERGRGELHLNDGSDGEGDGQHKKTSRIIMRAQGSLRVVLNSRLFPEMTARRVRPKTVEFTAVDSAVPGDPASSDGQGDDDKRIKIFLVQLSSINDADALQHHLETRIQALQNRQN
jgi:Ran-binding protein 3